MQILEKMINDAAATPAALKAQVIASGRNPDSCSAEVNALAVEQQAEVDGLNGLKNAKIEVCLAKKKL